MFILNYITRKVLRFFLRTYKCSTYFKDLEAILNLPTLQLLHLDLPIIIEDLNFHL
jgi:hypothetical protein